MFASLLAALIALGSAQPDDSYLYRTLMLRAAPGQLLEVIELFKARMPAYEATGGHAPLMMRHSQGDQWDLLLLYPMGSFTEYYSAERTAQRASRAAQSGMSDAEFERTVNELVSWREDLFVSGPPLEEVRRAFAENAYYHVEMFIALPGKRDALLEERRMENAYLRGIDRPLNLIFTRVAGAAWDLYTIGFYADVKHWAAVADVPAERRDASARAAGFEGADRIGTYMRTLIQLHHDTLATAVH
ncbi:MAG: hypothetical protein PVJ43_07485 [Gemmatimonadales bacterium]|jgi:hypothetical protein